MVSYMLPESRELNCVPQSCVEVLSLSIESGNLFGNRAVGSYRGRVAPSLIPLVSLEKEGGLDTDTRRGRTT